MLYKLEYLDKGYLSLISLYTQEMHRVEEEGTLVYNRPRRD